MPEPLFTDILQVGIVVRDLDEALRTYVHDYGIGPWRLYQLTPDTVADQLVDGAPGAFAVRTAVTKVGNVEIELMQPLDDTGPLARFLATKGPGVHHLAVATRESYGETRDALAGRGRELQIGGAFAGIPFTFISTEADLGVDVEIFDFTGADGTPEPTGVYPE